MGEENGVKINLTSQMIDGSHEANYLKLNCSKLKKTFSWKPNWNINMTMEKVVEWYSTYLNGEDILGCTKKQIRGFFQIKIFIVK